MKKFYFFLLLIFSGLSISAQENNENENKDEYQTIFGNHKITKIRGFGGPMLGFTTFDKQFAQTLGGGGGLILNDKVILGGFGYGLTNAVDGKKNIPYGGESDYYHEMKMNYGAGGLWFGYIFMGSRAIHPVLHTQIGWGNISFSKDNIYSADDPHDGIFLVNPILELEMNFTHFFRVGVGANCNFVFGVNDSHVPGYKNSDFWNPGIFTTFKFGFRLITGYKSMAGRLIIRLPAIVVYNLKNSGLSAMGFIAF